MDNKIRLSQTLGIVLIAILLSILTEYVPSLAILGFLISIPYATIGILSNNKHSISSIIFTFIVLMASVNSVYAITICILHAIPGVIIGNIVNKNLLKKDNNKFEPIYGGAIAFVVSTIGFYFTMNMIFKVNILNEFMDILKNILNTQMDIISKSDINFAESIKVDDLILELNNMLPTFLIIQGLISAFITYYGTYIVIKKNKKITYKMPKFADFHLPGNALTALLVMYSIVIFLGYINSNLKTELIMLNIQYVFNTMFIIQGIAVSIFFLRKWSEQGSSRKILISSFFVFMIGFTAVSLIGILDSLMDFRRLRSYKST